MHMFQFNTSTLESLEFNKDLKIYFGDLNSLSVIIYRSPKRLKSLSVLSLKYYLH